MNNFCEGSFETGSDITANIVSFLSTSISDIDNAMGSVVNLNMCSADCPCDREKALPWAELADSELNAFGRRQPNECDVCTE